jgi:predicted transcriptional regulator
MQSATKQTNTTTTTVTLPSDLFQKVETLAGQLGVLPDELYRQALTRLLAAYEETEITRRLNEFYDHEDSSLDPVLMQMQTLSLKPEKW